jgi:hypothetical protein
MNFNTAQQSWIDVLNLSEAYLDDIRNQLPHPKYADFTLNNLNYMPAENSTKFQIDSYNAIKGSEWPNCYTFDDLKNLPKHIIDECRDVHGFNFLIYNENNIDQTMWNNYSSGSWPVWELIRYKNVILNLSEYLTDKVVVDYACHAGIVSLCALHVGTKFVKASNVRPEFVKLANRMLNLSSFKNQFSTEVADIHDYDNNIKICTDVDTVLLYGIMYHIHDHCQVLDSITEANPQTIIIDSFVPNSIIDSTVPLVEWFTEDSNDVWHGWYKNKQIIPVGAPNLSWFKMYMESRQYRMVYQQKYFSLTMKFDIPDTQRSVIVFQKY